MTDDFANAPFAFGIAERLAFRRYPAQQHIQSIRLGTQHRKNFLLGYLTNIALVVRSVFRFEWLSSCHRIVLVIAKFRFAPFAFSRCLCVKLMMTRFWFSQRRKQNTE